MGAKQIIAFILVGVVLIAGFLCLQAQAQEKGETVYIAEDKDPIHYHGDKACEAIKGSEEVVEVSKTEAEEQGFIACDCAKK